MCIEIGSSFSYLRTTHLEVEGVLDDIEVDYDWQPSPCQRCSSFGHESGSCISMCETMATMGETSNQSLASESLVTEKVVEASSPPTDPVVLGLEHVRTECTIIPETSSGKHKAQAVDMLAREPANKEPVIADKTPIALFEERQVTRAPGAKPKFRSAPHAKKSISTSPPKCLNQFSALETSDEEVESLIAKAQQSRKTVHPWLLGASGRDLEPGGPQERAPKSPP